MKRLRPLSHSLAFLAATSLSLAPALAPAAYADMQTATTTTSTDTATDTTTTTTTSTGTAADTTTTTTEVTDSNLATIIAGLTSTDIEQVQSRYDELQDLLATKKGMLEGMAEGAEKTALEEEIEDLEILEAAFEAIIEEYEEANADEVISTETITNSDGSTTTTTTYADGSFTETTTPATESDSDSNSSSSGSGSGSDSGGGGGDMLSQLMENPMVQALVTALLQKLLNGGLGDLKGLLSGLLGQGATSTPNGDQLLGRVCNGGSCSGSEYNTPNPTGTTGNTTQQAIQNGMSNPQTGSYYPSQGNYSPTVDLPTTDPDTPAGPQ